MARQRQVFGDLAVEIDRTLCVGFGDCIDVGPELFELDDDGVVRFRSDAGAAQVARERLLAACDVCPVDALTVIEGGIRIAPRGR